MGRLSDWESRLAEYISRFRLREFEYGQNDCALFAAGAIEAITGQDPAARWRGRYTSMKTGLQKIKAAGYRNHIEAAAELLPEIPVSGALPGDIAEVETETGPALGVFQGALIYVLGAKGILLVKRSEAKRAFGVL